jgi:hypothetical protein
MPHYRIESSKKGEGLALLKGHEKNIVSLGIGAGGEFLLESKKPLKGIDGLVVLSDEEHEALRSKTNRPTTLTEQTSLPGMATLEDAKHWTIEPYSPRKADISQAVVSAGVPALGIVLGAGRGDKIYLGRPLQLPAEARRLHIKVQARCNEDESMALGLVLTTARERPWLETPTQVLHPGVWEELDYDLDAFKKEKRLKASRLVLALVTDADDGQVMIERFVVGA